ncbi:hypothetical protein NQ315_008943 [Exocentrus adspersus]|uniref:C2H2-type domain-containing protein n=1 Tax=Exocentrus adspersus TaxID=1586481 RepID=A0AAV8V8M1_9CUCU|nr:hypothetical protein NQ315_008943 [Exocentrus adspersus]
MPVLCFVCEKIFSTQSNLNKHSKKVHKSKPKIVSYDQSKRDYKCLENECNSSFRNNIDFINHLSEDHHINIENFLAWKQLIEKKDQSNYVVLRSCKVNGKLVKYYTCNRSGKKSSRSNNVRLAKSQGSCKLNRYCTSSIKVVQDKNFLVTWNKTHYGHSIDLQHIRIPKMDRSVIAAKLTLGVSPSRILDSHRDKIGENINREDLITRKDIQNIKNSYHINISEGIRHENDAVSVELWIKQCEQEENNPILFYKKQGVEDNVYGLLAVDFCLVIMTDFQKNMFKKFGDNIVAVDGTHGLNNYNFELTSVLVVDEFGEGIPVAFMFTNRKDTYIYELFFNAIKLSIGILSAKTFMTDIVSTYYSAWCSIMGPAVHQLFCSWHVDRAWQQNLSKISDKTKRSEVYKTLTPKTLVFISKIIIARTSKNGLIVSERAAMPKKVKRLDKSLQVLLKYVRDKCVDRVIKKIKGKQSIHVKDIMSRHKTASSSKFSVECDSENQTKWYINTMASNKDQELYCVQKLFDQSCCDLECRECKICSHTYSCTCNDFCVANKICKHIHYIEMTYYPKTRTKEVLQSNELSEMKLSTKYVDKSDILRQNFSANILKTMTKLQNADKYKLTDEVIVQIESHLATVQKLLELPSTSDKPISLSQMSHNEPANKKIDKQHRFFSTQKKKNTCKNICKKASTSELNLDKDLSKKIDTKNKIYIEFLIIENLISERFKRARNSSLKYLASYATYEIVTKSSKD